MNAVIARELCSALSSTLHNANNTKTSTGTNQKVSPIERFLSNQKVSLQSKSFGWEKSLSGEKSFGGEKSMGRNLWGEINGEKSIDGLSASKIKLFLTISPSPTLYGVGLV